MEIVSLRELPTEARVRLVQELGYDVGPDGVHLLRDGSPAMDAYAGVQLRLDNLAVLPGSVTVLDNNPVSIASYLEDHGDIL
jgi:hypothetical protein